MKVGELQEKNMNGTKSLFGNISTMTFSMALEFYEGPKSEKNANSPFYTISGKNNSGGRVQIGAAWIKHLKRGPNSGEEFLTITIDDPSLPRALNLAAFKNADTGIWEIMFRRRQDPVS